MKDTEVIKNAILSEASKITYTPSLTTRDVLYFYAPRAAIVAGAALWNKFMHLAILSENRYAYPEMCSDRIFVDEVAFFSITTAIWGGVYIVLKDFVGMSPPLPTRTPIEIVENNIGRYMQQYEAVRAKNTSKFKTELNTLIMSLTLLPAEVINNVVSAYTAVPTLEEDIALCENAAARDTALEVINRMNAKASVQDAAAGRQ